MAPRATVSATFELHTRAELAVRELAAAGFSSDQIALGPGREPESYSVAVTANERFRVAEGVLKGCGPVHWRTSIDDPTMSQSHESTATMLHMASEGDAQEQAAPWVGAPGPTLAEGRPESGVSEADWIEQSLAADTIATPPAPPSGARPGSALPEGDVAEQATAAYPEPPDQE